MCKKENGEGDNKEIEKNYAEVSKKILEIVNKYISNEKIRGE